MIELYGKRRNIPVLRIYSRGSKWVVERIGIRNGEEFSKGIELKHRKRDAVAYARDLMEYWYGDYIERIVR